MPVQGAVQISLSGVPIWCHWSQSNQRDVFRRITDQGTFEIEGEPEILEFCSLGQCKKFMKTNHLPISDTLTWIRVFHYLETNGPPKSGGKEEVQERQAIVVPITPLRKFYDFLKCVETESLEVLAAFYANNPAPLIRLWNKSHDTFKSYDNKNQDWGEALRMGLPNSPGQLGKVTDTDEFTAFLKDNPISLNNNVKYAFVQRELNPWRTKQGFFSNDAPATKSGRGGMDLLLKSEGTGNPVVGEVKVNSDKNAFYALVQAMTYAVELSTENQLARLKKHKSEFRNLAPHNAKVEILILQINRDKDASRKNVADLIQKLNKSSECQSLGKCILLHNVGEEWRMPHRH